MPKKTKTQQKVKEVKQKSRMLKVPGKGGVHKDKKNRRGKDERFQEDDEYCHRREQQESAADKVLEYLSYNT